VARSQALDVMPPQLHYAADAYEAATGADAVAIITEWDEYRALDLRRLAKIMRGNLLVDFRNVYDCDVVAQAGLTYASIGRRTSVALRQVWPEEAGANDLIMA
jgi:UDPglucose 6-dehydrogenase